eukprot:SAG31_NODE_21872_length_539_cov_0.547727_1_plen_141_part_10
MQHQRILAQNRRPPRLAAKGLIEPLLTAVEGADVAAGDADGKLDVLAELDAARMLEALTETVAAAEELAEIGTRLAEELGFGLEVAENFDLNPMIDSVLRRSEAEVQTTAERAAVKHMFARRNGREVCLPFPDGSEYILSM